MREGALNNISITCGAYAIIICTSMRNQVFNASEAG